MSELAGISRFYQSFSGTDTLAFIMLPGTKPIVLGSLTTISYSMYRNKKPVINIGRTNINGVTRGSRIYAGTMIFTLINQHWLREVVEQIDWLKNYKDLKVDELPLFDIMIVSANEYGNTVVMYIYGIDYTDEAQTISVEDLFTENTFSFVARDISSFKSQNVFNSSIGDKSYENQDSNINQRYYIIDNTEYTFSQIEQLEKEYKQAEIELKEDTSRLHKLNRELYYPASKPFIGNDVLEIQNLLNKTKLFNLELNGVYDAITSQAVREYQSSVGLPPTGNVNDKTYNYLLNSNTEIVGQRVAVVMNKNGAFVYIKPSLLSDIVGIENYKNQVLILDFITTTEDNKVYKWYQTEMGYILAEDMYSSNYDGNIISFPSLSYGDIGVHVTLLQQALSEIYPTFTTINGKYDYETSVFVKKFQEEHGLLNNGIVDYNTWLLLETYAKDIFSTVSDDGFEMEVTRDPGTYIIKSSNVLEELKEFSMSLSFNSYSNVKVSVSCTFKDVDTPVIFSRFYTIKETKTIFLNDFRNAFIYNPSTNSTPLQVEFVIYPYNKTPYKWIIKYIDDDTDVE